MYDEILLKQRMAARALNFHRLAKKAGVDPKTAKSIVTKGTGQPETIIKVANALGFESLAEIVKRTA